MLHPLTAATTNEGDVPASALRTLHLLLAELPLKTAVRLATDITQLPKNVLYEAALTWKAERETDG